MIRFLGKLVGGVKQIIPSIAQIILAIFILLGICKLLVFITGAEDAVGLFTNIIGQVPICEYWSDILAATVEISEMGVAIVYAGFLVVINVIVIWLIPGEGFFAKTGATVFGLALQIVVAVIAAGYVVFLSMIADGQITEMQYVISMIANLTLPMLTVLALTFFFLASKKASLGL